MTTAFITDEELIAYLKLNENLISSDLAAIAIAGGCQAVIDYMSQELIEAEATVFTPRILSNGRDTLILPNFPLLTVESLLQDDLEISLEDEDKVRIIPEGGLLIVRGQTFLQSSFYEAEITYGYEDDAIPATPKTVALQVAMRIYEFALYKQEAIAGLEATYESGAGQLTESEEDALFSYRCVT